MSASTPAVAFSRSVDRAPGSVRSSRDTADPTLFLLRRYRRRGDRAARAELLQRHLPLVRLLARKLAMRIGGAADVDDLMSAGTVGLIQALDSFDLSRNNSFPTYASRRIHGAMLDELRERDWVPRSVRSKARKLLHASGRIESGLGRPAAAGEMAAVLGIDLPTYWSWRQSVDGAVLVSLDDTASEQQESSGRLSRIGEPEAVDSLIGLGREESVEALAAALAQLPQRERMVLVLYFYEELKLREIAEVMHLTESRISQIRTLALKRLRGGLSPELAEVC